MKIEECTEGKRVIHANHGTGTILTKGDTDSEVFVDFDKKPESWDKILCVSIGCLKEA